MNDDADLKGKDIIVECKVMNTKESPSMPKSHLSKIKAQSQKWGRDWAYVIRTKTGEEFVITSLDTFAGLYNGNKEERS